MNTAVGESSQRVWACISPAAQIVRTHDTGAVTSDTTTTCNLRGSRT